MKRTIPPLVCFRCGRRPAEIPEYTECVRQDLSCCEEHYVWNNEGTLNHDTGKFACDGCYLAIGSPSERGGWTAPESMDAFRKEMH